MTTLADRIRQYETPEPEPLSLGQVWFTVLSIGEIVYMIEQPGEETIVGLLFRPGVGPPFIIRQAERDLRLNSTLEVI